jgi:N,N'-diacetyllegionaminate synthase
MEGPDHKASLEPDQLKEMVKAIRNIELALGSGIKKPSKVNYQTYSNSQKINSCKN